MFSGADTGFPVGGGADPLGGGAPTYDFVKFSEKLHEIEKILGRGGARAGCTPPKSATGSDLMERFISCIQCRFHILFTQFYQIIRLNTLSLQNVQIIDLILYHILFELILNKKIDVKEIQCSWHQDHTDSKNSYI